MKRVVWRLLLAAAFVAVTAAAALTVMDTSANIARRENQEKTALIQRRLDDTISLLSRLSQDAYILSPDRSYQEKAAFLTDMNLREGLGYMMLRILDGDINIYREDIGLASNLGSRDYMRRLYSSGELQVTDAFLAGADGTTINYTVATAIEREGKVTGALMAAIYGEEIDGYLAGEGLENVLVGSQLQYMGGVDQERFGLMVAQVLMREGRLSRPVENILLDFQEKRAGYFWGLGHGVQYFAYSPVAHTSWVVMTEMPVLPYIMNILPLYALAVAALLVAGVMLARREKKKAKQ